MKNIIKTVLKNNQEILKDIKEIDGDIIATMKKVYSLDLGNNYGYNHLDNALKENAEFMQDISKALELSYNENGCNYGLFNSYDEIEFTYNTSYGVGKEIYTIIDLNDLLD